jgi:hypothetical protein
VLAEQIDNHDVGGNDLVGHGCPSWFLQQNCSFLTLDNIGINRIFSN